MSILSQEICFVYWEATSLTAEAEFVFYFDSLVDLVISKMSSLVDEIGIDESSFTDRGGSSPFVNLVSMDMLSLSMANEFL